MILRSFLGKEEDEVAAVFSGQKDAFRYAGWWNREELQRHGHDSPITARAEEIDFYPHGTWQPPPAPPTGVRPDMSLRRAHSIGRSEPWPVRDAEVALTNVSRSLGLLPGSPGETVHRAVLKLIEQAEQVHMQLPPDAVLTIGETAAMLKLSEQDTRRLAEAGELPGAKLGDHWRFSRQALLDRLEDGQLGRN